MLRSISRDLRWPALVDSRSAVVLGFLGQLRRTQWLPQEQLQSFQARQLSARLEHARLNTPFFADRLGSGVVTPLTARERLGQLPALQRVDLQSHAAQLFSSVPWDHGRIGETRTSGSTGQPVTVRCTQMAQSLRAAVTLRGHRWHGVDFGLSFAAIRGGISRNGRNVDVLPDWGGVTRLLFNTAPSRAMDISTPLEQQRDWLQSTRPAILLTYPSNLAGLLQLMPAPWPGLTRVLSMSETLSPELRRAVSEQWGVPMHDTYSSEELGPIAIECSHGRYHCPEHLLVEVVREDGQPCAAGEVGRVLVTDTWNFATGLLRYDIRDYAEASAVCECGRGLPTLNRIMGRVRNIMTLPDGRRFWPLFGLREYGELAPMRQFQFVQTALDALTVRHVSDRALAEGEEAAVAERIRGQIGYPLRITFERVEGSLNTPGSYKFEEFRSLLDMDPAGGCTAS